MTLYHKRDMYDNDTALFYNNLYYSLDPSDESKEMFPPDLLQFHDLPSVGSTGNKWMDPMFQDADLHNYQLSSESPALTMGIQQIRLDNFGIQSNK